MGWYREWFGREYLDLYAHRDDSEAKKHVAFVAEFLEGDPLILDLACGAGRHSAALRDRGLRTLGLDLSMTLLAHGPRHPQVRGDMSYLPFAEEKFDWVLNFFTSFGYFPGERQNFRVLEELRRVLKIGGGFVIDFMNVQKVIGSLRLEETQQVGAYTVDIRRRFDEENQRIEKIMVLKRENQKDRTFVESVRAYRPEEVEIGLQWAGLQVLERFGTFSASPWTPESDRLILVGRRKE